MNDISKKESSEISEKKREPFSRLREEIDHLFDEFHDGWPFKGTHRGNKELTSGLTLLNNIRVPSVDISDRKKDVQVKAELPGMDENDIEVELSGNRLTISGEKKEEREEGEKGSDYYLSERRYGTFSRSFTVPDGIDSNKVEASFDKGVLSVTLPKTAEAQKKTKKIKVKGKK